jgi:putative endonuclease
MRGDPRRELGDRGERLACKHLEARGFEVLERNFRTRRGELDVVARNDQFLVFCEVKTRVLGEKAGPLGPFEEAAPLGPFAAIGSRKRERLRRMAREWLATRTVPAPRPPELRFDAIGVEFDTAGRITALEHLEDAF